MSQGDLDPKDWDAFRAQAHRLLDASLDKMQTADEGRVWSPVPDTLREAFNREIPRAGYDTESLLTQIMPYGVGNTHPRFFGWVHGAGAPSGLLAEIIALKVARDQALEGVAKAGIANSHLIGYTSAQAHSCVKRAFDILGIGSAQLRVIPCNQDFEMDLSTLQQQINTDRADGLQPFCVVGTAGAVNVGAIDDLEGIADIAAAEHLWFHIDGAFGATARLSKYAKDRLTGIARADSLAFDFHKWL